jgi:hypothetical protein
MMRLSLWSFPDGEQVLGTGSPGTRGICVAGSAMTCQDNEILLNNVLIQMARSFLQYGGECSLWVSLDKSSQEAQVLVLAARQRQDVGEIVQLLTQREHFIDFGSFPTEYTDQQFLSLSAMMPRLLSSQELVCRRAELAAESLRTTGDDEAGSLMTRISSHERDILHGLREISAELSGN